MILDNQGVVKATPVKRKGVVKDKDYRDIRYHNASTKHLTIPWTHGHRTLEQATTYSDYKDIQGNNNSDVLANMGDNLPMDFQQPQPHNIVLIGQIMPTPTNTWIMQVCRQQHTPEVHWVSLLPMKHYRRNAWTPWLWGQVRWWGTGAPWERLPAMCAKCGQQHGLSVRSRLAHCPAWSGFWDLWRRSWTDWKNGHQPLTPVMHQTAHPGVSYGCHSHNRKTQTTSRGRPLAVPHDVGCPDSETEIRRPHTATAAITPMAH